MHLFCPIPLFIFLFHTIFYIIVSSPFCWYPINEHQGNLVNYQWVNFERVNCVGDFNANKDIKNCDLPPYLLRLTEQKDKQIIPHEELTEIVWAIKINLSHHTLKRFK